MARPLREVPSTEVLVEPGTQEGRRRNDIALRGPGQVGRRNIDYDLKIYSINSTYAFRDGTTAPRSQEADPVEYYRDLAERWMSRVERDTDRRRPEAQVEFKPLVLSSGGLIPRGSWKAMESWKELEGAPMRRMLEAISISLLLSRTGKRGECLLLDGRGDDDAE